LDSQESFTEWYKFNHPSIQLCSDAHYGLVPWMNPAEAKLVANPGCYATAILMGLLPLLKLDVINPDSIVIDAKSGTTGAGKKASEALLFSEVEGECLPYKVGVHQHLPEINLFAKKITNTVMNPFFTTSLLATRRGIVAGLYGNLKSGKTDLDVSAAFKEFYGNYPLVKITEKASLKAVVGTAQTHLSFHVVGEKLYLFSCLDNLLKGAASQAIENFNLIHGFSVTAGLEHLEAIL
jgi:N-acetyl-gamma-glutamyl-phosphate reductase